MSGGVAWDFKSPATAHLTPAVIPGNEAYAEGFKTGDDSQLKMLRVVNVPDIVPKVLAGTALYTFFLLGCMQLISYHSCLQLPYDAWTWRDAVSPLRFFRFVMTPIKIALGGASPPEAKYHDAFHHGGIQ